MPDVRLKVVSSFWLSGCTDNFFPRFIGHTDIIGIENDSIRRLPAICRKLAYALEHKSLIFGSSGYH